MKDENLDHIRKLYAQAFAGEQLNVSVRRIDDETLEFSGEMLHRDVGVCVRWQKEPIVDGALAPALIDQIRGDLQHELRELDEEEEDADDW